MNDFRCTALTENLNILVHDVGFPSALNLVSTLGLHACRSIPVCNIEHSPVGSRTAEVVEPRRKLRRGLLGATETKGAKVPFN